MVFIDYTYHICSRKDPRRQQTLERTCYCFFVQANMPFEKDLCFLVEKQWKFSTFTEICLKSRLYFLKLSLDYFLLICNTTNITLYLTAQQKRMDSRLNLGLLLLTEWPQRERNHQIPFTSLALLKSLGEMPGGRRQGGEILRGCALA